MTKPSRELDKLVAEKVFGQTVVQHNSIGRPDYWSKNADGSTTLVPQYSKHIASAWLVVEKLGLSVVYLSGQWHCGFAEDQFGERDVGDGFMEDFNMGIGLAEDGYVTADTAPLAICLAALKVVSLD